MRHPSHRAGFADSLPPQIICGEDGGSLICQAVGEESVFTSKKSAPVEPDTVQLGDWC